MELLVVENNLNFNSTKAQFDWRREKEFKITENAFELELEYDLDALSTLKIPEGCITRLLSRLQSCAFAPAVAGAGGAGWWSGPDPRADLDRFRVRRAPQRSKTC